MFCGACTLCIRYVYARSLTSEPMKLKLSCIQVLCYCIISMYHVNCVYHVNNYYCVYVQTMTDAADFEEVGFIAPPKPPHTRYSHTQISDESSQPVAPPRTTSRYVEKDRKVSG